MKKILLMLGLIVIGLFLVGCGTGKAIGTSFEEVEKKSPIEKCQMAGYDVYVKTSYKDANGNYLKSPVEGCCKAKSGEKGLCYSPSSQECFSAGKLHSNFDSFYCGNSNTWYKCSQESNLKKDILSDNGKYLCALGWGEKGWLSCPNSFNIQITGNFHCNDGEWKKWLEGDGCTKGKYTNWLYQFKKGDWFFEYDGETELHTIGCCDGGKACSVSGDDCVAYNTPRDLTFNGNKGNYICDKEKAGNSWFKCNQNAEGIVSKSKEYVCHNDKWTKCTSELDGKSGLDEKKFDYTCHNGIWREDLSACAKCSDKEQCLFSDIIIKSADNKYSVEEYDLKSGRYGCGTGKQCINIKQEAFDYDAAYDNSQFICGDYNDWLKCTAKTKNVISDGGKFVCTGKVWKKIDNDYEGCKNCLNSNQCILSNLDTFKGTWKEDKLVGWVWIIKEEAQDKNRIGCNTDPLGCIDVGGNPWSGTVHAPNHIKDGKYLCYENNWMTCDKNAELIIAPDNFYYCVNKWKECGKDAGFGKVDANKFLCTSEGWIKCNKDQYFLVESDNSYLCNNGVWSWCGAAGMEGKVNGVFICKSKEWKSYTLYPITKPKTPIPQLK